VANLVDQRGLQVFCTLLRFGRRRVCPSIVNRVDLDVRGDDLPASVLLRRQCRHGEHLWIVPAQHVVPPVAAPVVLSEQDPDDTRLPWVSTRAVTAGEREPHAGAGNGRVAPSRKGMAQGCEDRIPIERTNMSRYIRRQHQRRAAPEKESTARVATSAHIPEGRRRRADGDEGKETAPGARSLRHSIGSEAFESADPVVRTCSARTGRPFGRLSNQRSDDQHRRQRGRGRFAKRVSPVRHSEFDAHLSATATHLNVARSGPTGGRVEPPCARRTAGPHVVRLPVASGIPVLNLLIYRRSSLPTQWSAHVRGSVHATGSDDSLPITRNTNEGGNVDGSGERNGSP